MNTDEHLLPTGWDNQVLAMGGNVLQSSTWAAFQQCLGRTVLYGAGTVWCWSGALRTARGGIKYLSIPYGPTVASADALTEAIASIKEVAKEHGATFARIEPVGQVSRDDVLAHAQAFAEVNPTHTHVLNLTKSDEVLRSGLESGHRNRVNGAVRRGISVQEVGAERMRDFLAMMDDTALRNHIKPYSHDYYETMYRELHTRGASRLYLASHSGYPVSAAISFEFGPTTYYAHAAAYQDRNRKIGASVVLVWQMIMDAKAAGKTQFDFWGVAPAGETNHKWAGLSAFKRGFGGVDKDYLGTFDVVVKTTPYRLYRLAKKVM